MQEVRSIRAVVDQINDDMAVLLLGEGESVVIYLPVAWLPTGVREGAVLRLGVTLDKAATIDGKRQVQSLLDSLGNEP